MIAGYLGKSDLFDRAVGTFAWIYADRVREDYDLFLAAITSGEVLVAEG